MAYEDYNNYPNVGAGDVDAQEHNPQQVLDHYEGAYNNDGANGVMGNEILHHIPIDYYNAIYVLLGHSMLGRNPDNIVTVLDDAQWSDDDIMWTLIYWNYEERVRTNGVLTNHIRRIMHLINLYELRVMNNIRNNNPQPDNQQHDNHDNHDNQQHDNQGFQYPNNYNEQPPQQHNQQHHNNQHHNNQHHNNQHNLDPQLFTH